MLDACEAVGILTNLAPLAQTLEAELMHARVGEAFTPAAGQTNGTIRWRRGACSGRVVSGNWRTILLLSLLLLLVDADLVLAALTAALCEICKLYGSSWQCAGSNGAATFDWFNNNRGGDILYIGMRLLHQQRIGHSCV